MTARGLVAAVLVVVSVSGTCGAGEARGKPMQTGLPAELARHRVPGNLLKNPSFEGNWFNRRFAERRRFLLLQASDMGVGEADGHIDHWRFHGIPIPESWDTSVARSGWRSVRFQRAGRATQLVRFAGEQHWRAGGAYYAMYLPMEERLAAQLAKRPIVVGAWCKTNGVPKGAEPQLAVTIDGAVRQGYESTRPVRQGRATASVSFSAGTHDWEFKELRIDPERLKGTPFFATVALASRGKGVVWFDDSSCVEEADPAQPNRVANAGFEALDEAGWPRGWSRPARWTWFRNTYYSWTGWSHAGRKTFRGGAVLDRMIAFSGNASLRFNVLPGDNFAIQSAPIILNQDRPRPIEVRAVVKADNLRTLEIMAQDENGGWLPQGDFLGDDMEEPGAYNFGSTGCGTYDWACVRKYFSPRKPVRSLRLFLCARGFDGRIVERNLVGTLWLDDIRLFEHGVTKDRIPAASIPVEPKAAPPLYRFKVVDIDLGDRLWGKNAVQMLIEFKGRDALKHVQRTSLHIELTDPSGKTKRSRGTTKVLKAPTAGNPTGCAVATTPFAVDRLCQSWEEQYRLAVRLAQPRSSRAYASEFCFGTPSQLIQPGVSAHYLYPDEKLVVYANLNLARGSFAELARCDFVLERGGKKKTIVELEGFSRILRPQRAPDYINTRSLVQVALGREGLTVHPCDEPVRDNAVAVRLYGRSKLLAETKPIRFGFMAPLPKPQLPKAIRRTAVSDKGFITVNGEVYFPVYWTPHFGICPEANYPPTQFGYKAVNLTKLVYAKGQMPDDEVKAKLLARIAEVKDEPKLFHYELGEGEMQLQGKGWRDRLEWCKRAIPWIRRADPNHLINGPISWLVGHPRHNAAMRAFVPHWDVIGVEASFETVPKVNEFASPRMKERRTAVLIGLETYFYQPNRVLRWRGYRGILNGASGIGLCPSGMMQSRPDKVNYLRGLNAEFRGLAPVITADEPKENLSVGSKLIDTMERIREGKRYVFAVRSRDDAGPLRVRFGFPRGARYSKVKVRFEGRMITPTAKGFEDKFAQPQSVHVYELAP